MSALPRKRTFAAAVEMSAKCQKRILVSATFGKNSRSHMRNPEFVFADRAAENFIARIARNVPEWRQTAFFDPAARTKIIAPAFNRKIRKPLRSKARRIVFRLYLRYLLLSLGKAALDMRQALFSTRCYFLRCLPHVVADGHSWLQCGPGRFWRCRWGLRQEPNPVIGSTTAQPSS